MKIECWVSVCPHCGIPWPIDYGETAIEPKRFFEHPKEAPPLVERLDWEKRWREASRGLIQALQTPPEDPMYQDAMWLIEQSNAQREALLEEAHAKRKLCSGSGELVAFRYWRNEETCPLCGLGKTGHEGCSRRWVARIRKPLIPRPVVWGLYLVTVLAAGHADPLSTRQQIACGVWVFALYIISRVKR